MSLVSAKIQDDLLFIQVTVYFVYLLSYQESSVILRIFIIVHTMLITYESLGKPMAGTVNPESVSSPFTSPLAPGLMHNWPQIP